MCVDTYKKLLKELSESKYSGVVSFSRYNEPMAFPEQFKYFTRLARQMLPKAKLVSNTNGDYLSKENLDGLSIDELTIMDYDCIGYMPAIDKLLESWCQIH